MRYLSKQEMGLILRQARTKKGLSAKQAAESLNMGYRSYLNIEYGRREISRTEVVEIAVFAQVSCDRLVFKAITE